jgi:hypothetical protein
MQSIVPHGFSGKTFVNTAHSNFFCQIKYIFENIQNGENPYIRSYDTNNQDNGVKQVKSATLHESDYYCNLVFSDQSNPIQCSPLQPFYRLQDQQWVVACALCPGDILLCANNQSIALTSITLIKKRMQIYSLKIQDGNTFLVSAHKIITRHCNNE